MSMAADGITEGTGGPDLTCQQLQSQMWSALGLLPDFADQEVDDS